MKIEYLFNILETRNAIAHIFKLPEEVLTIVVDPICDFEHMPYVESFKNMFNFHWICFKSFGVLANKIEEINFDANLSATVDVRGVKYKVRVFAELERKAKHE